MAKRKLYSSLTEDDTQLSISTGKKKSHYTFTSFVVILIYLLPPLWIRTFSCFYAWEMKLCYRNISYNPNHHLSSKILSVIISRLFIECVGQGN